MNDKRLSDLPQQTGVSATSVSQPISPAAIDWSILPFRSIPEIERYWGPRTHAGDLARLIEADGGIRDDLLCARVKGIEGKPILYDGRTRLPIWFSRRERGIVEPCPFAVIDFDNLGDVIAKVVAVQLARRNITAMQAATAALDIKRRQGFAIVARGQGRPGKGDKRIDSLKPLPSTKALAAEFGVSDPVIRTAIKVMASNDPKAKKIRTRMLLPQADKQYLSPIQANWQIAAIKRDRAKHEQAQVAAKRQKQALKMKVSAVDAVTPNGIYVGDAVETMRKIEAESVDLLLTSPPYANIMHYDMGNIWKGDYADYLDTFVRKPLIEAKRVLRYGGRLVLNFDNTYRSNEKAKAGDDRDRVGNIYNCWKDYSRIAEDEVGLLPMAYHIWYKQNCPNYFAHGSRDCRQPVYNPNTEFLLVWAKDSVRHPSPEIDSDITQKEFDRFCLSMWYISPQVRLPVDHPDYHVCPFPEEVAYRAIKLYSPRNGVVLDPFLGSGTTAFVAKATGRQYIGIDIAPTYAESARKRLATLDGLTASQRLKAITRFVLTEGERSDGMKTHRARRQEHDGDADGPAEAVAKPKPKPKKPSGHAKGGAK